MNRYLFLLILLLTTATGLIAQDNVPFTKATDLYYGTAYSTCYNHQLWLTTEGLTYDPVNGTMEGTDGYSMRLDLYTNSATDITGTYEIVGPKFADKAGCMNKKYTYWTYYVKGGFSDQKLTIGTCTITCTSAETYDITYSVQEIDKGPTHQGTIHNIPVLAVTEQGKTYTLHNQCPQTTGWEENSQESSKTCSKQIINGHLVLVRDGVRYTVHGNSLP